MNLEERILECKKDKTFNELCNSVNGTLYFNGDKIDLFEFFNNNILKNNEKQTNLIQDSTASEIEFLEF